MQLLGNLNEVQDQLFGALVAVARLLGHHFRQDGGQVVGDRRVELARVQRFHVLMVVQLFQGRAFRHRRLPRQQMVKRAAERIDVAANIRRPRLDRLLGRNVVERAERHSRLRDRALHGIDVASQPHVHDLGPALGRDQDVRRFDVAMHHAALGGMRQAGGNLQHVLDRIGRTEAAVPNK